MTGRGVCPALGGCGHAVLKRGLRQRAWLAGPRRVEVERALLVGQEAKASREGQSGSEPGRRRSKCKLRFPRMDLGTPPFVEVWSTLLKLSEVLDHKVTLPRLR